MSVSDNEEWRAERDLALWKECLDVESLYRYTVAVPQFQTFLCNTIATERIGERTLIKGIDCWIYDALMRSRVCATIEIVAREYSIVDMRAEVSA